MNNKLFETATRNKWRFPFNGAISVEDLWDLSMENLNKVFKALNKEAKVAEEESLLTEKTAEDAVVEGKLAIVRYIADVKINEQKDRSKAAENAEKRKHILSIIAAKQAKQLEDCSIEDLQKMLDDLK